MTLKAIENAALKLPVRSRGKLAAALLSSLDAEDPTVIEREWIAEADRRFRAYRAGKTGGLPSKKAIAEARSALCN